MYHALIFVPSNIAVIRHALCGTTTDKEFEDGCRVHPIGAVKSKLELIAKLLDDGFEILNENQWQYIFKEEYAIPRIPTALTQGIHRASVAVTVSACCRR